MKHCFLFLAALLLVIQSICAQNCNDLEVKSRVRFADCYNSINDAVISLRDSGGIVYIPPGTFLVESSIFLSSNISLIGSGMGVTFIKPKTCFEGYALITDSTNVRFPPLWDKDKPELECTLDLRTDSIHYTDSNITISNLTIDCMSYCKEFYGIFMVGHTCYRIPSIKNIVIQNVQVLNVKTQGICINGENVSINNCEVRNCGKNGIHLNGDQIHVSNSTAIDCRDNALEIGFAKNVTISNCTFRGNNNGLLVRNSRNVDVSNCVASENTGKGFWLWTAESTEVCENISIQNCISDTNTVGIQLYVKHDTCKLEWDDSAKDYIVKDFHTCWGKAGNIHNITLNGNIISRNVEGIRLRTDRYLVDNEVQENEIDSLRAVSIINNTVTHNKLSAIHIANAREILVSGNLCYDNYIGTFEEGGAIHVHDSKFVTVTGNKCYDRRLPQYQKYGYEESGNADSNWICINDFTGYDDEHEHASPLGLHTLYCCFEPCESNDPDAGVIRSGLKRTHKCKEPDFAHPFDWLWECFGNIRIEISPKRDLLELLDDLKDSNGARPPAPPIDGISLHFTLKGNLLENITFQFENLTKEMRENITIKGRGKWLNKNQLIIEVGEITLSEFRTTLKNKPIIVTPVFKETEEKTGRNFKKILVDKKNLKEVLKNFSLVVKQMVGNKSYDEDEFVIDVR